MNELSNAFKKNPIAWSIFTLYLAGWFMPVLINVFFTSSAPHQVHTKDHHSSFSGFLILSIFYLLLTLTMGFLTKKNNIYLKLSGYIGISLIIFVAIYNG
jgi:hypothetical protein